MPLRSAGILLYRLAPELEVLLVHPGGPYWQRRDRGAWQIPKGAIDPGEEPEAAARREIAEEIGIMLAPAVELIPLGEVRQSGGKYVEGFAAEHGEAYALPLLGKAREKIGAAGLVHGRRLQPDG